MVRRGAYPRLNTLDGPVSPSDTDCNDCNELQKGRCTVASITIRNLDDAIKTRLRTRAARHDRSMEEEARIILKEALYDRGEDRGLGSLIHNLFMSAGGVELDLPARTQAAERPELSE